MDVGIDILETERFKNYEGDKKKLAKIFTKKEIEYFDKFQFKTTHICGNFCAKEAVSKALKTGLGKDIFLLDIEILHEENGAPYVNTKNQKLQKLLKNRKIDISISHTDLVATAICIIF